MFVHWPKIDEPTCSNLPQKMSHAYRPSRHHKSLVVLQWPPTSELMCEKNGVTRGPLQMALKVGNWGYNPYEWLYPCSKTGRAPFCATFSDWIVQTFYFYTWIYPLHRMQSWQIKVKSLARDSGGDWIRGRGVDPIYLYLDPQMTSIVWRSGPLKTRPNFQAKQG